MLAMSLPNTLERTRTDYHIAALAILTSSPDITDPLQHIQALLILAYLEHGLGDIQRASEFRTNAADFIVGWGWNLMDAYSTPPANFGVWGSLAMAYSAVPEESFDEYADAKRKAWWECWAVDILLEATGGIKRILVDTPIAVSIPQQPEDSAPSVRSFGITPGYILLTMIHFSVLPSTYPLACTIGRSHGLSPLHHPCTSCRAS